MLRKFCGPIPVSTIIHFRKSVLRVSIEPKGVRVTEVLEGFMAGMNLRPYPLFTTGRPLDLETIVF